ncbi:hypothetical protein [Halomicrobium zhouii]|uniref:hypothetical protein n=1 Tax=Halomicrobium zhouii TaxID=767519 RepID=UPI000B7F2ACE|nr:hypothetical protein [Halomicrobium zhouii]
MDDLVERESADVSLQSDYVAEMVHTAVSEARESIQRATETTAKAVEAMEHGLEETLRTFIAWAARHCVDVSDARDAKMTLWFDDTGLESTEKTMAEGLQIWREAGMPEERFRLARVRFSNGSMGQA